MKALLLALCLLAGQGFAAIAPNTVALWTLDNVLTDSSGNGYTLTQTGTVPFVTSPTPPQGTHAAGTFGGVQYAYSTDARTALSGSTTYTIEGYLRATSLASNAIFMSIGAVNNGMAIILVTDGTFRVVVDDARTHNSAAGVVLVNTWYYWAVVVNGTNVKAYVGIPGDAPSVVINVTDADPAFATAGSVYLGVLSYAPALIPFAAGYLDAIRISNVSRTTLPTVDSAISVDYLIVGGGGAGGSPNGGGGGGGGVLGGSATFADGATFPVVIGAAGAGIYSCLNGNTNSGGNSTFNGLTAQGGGGGGSYSGVSGKNGGSGGGKASYSGGTFGTGVVGQGYDGGNGVYGGGGGGGAGSVGGISGGGNAAGIGGAGGAGYASTIRDGSTTVYYGAGGGGCGDGAGGAGGSSGAGGAGTITGVTTAGSATVYGGGGGGVQQLGGCGTGGSGFAGIVIIRYLTAGFSALGTGGTITTSGSGASEYTIHTFTASGDFVAPVPAAGGGQLSPYLKQGQFPFVTPIWWRP